MTLCSSSWYNAFREDTTYTWQDTELWRRMHISPYGPLIPVYIQHRFSANNAVSKSI
jgi:hypothetical protein